MPMFPETTTLLCYVGDSIYRVLAYDKSRGGVLDEYVEHLERTPDEWPGWSARRKELSDVAARGLYTLQLMRGETTWHCGGWQRVSLMEAAQAATGQWVPITTPPTEMTLTAS